MDLKGYFPQFIIILSCVVCAAFNFNRNNCQRGILETRNQLNFYRKV